MRKDFFLRGARYKQGRIARFKMPRRFVFVAELPRNALGKVQHFRLREQWHDCPPT